MGKLLIILLMGISVASCAIIIDMNCDTGACKANVTSLDVVDCETMLRSPIKTFSLNPPGCPCPDLLCTSIGSYVKLTLNGPWIDIHQTVTSLEFTVGYKFVTTLVVRDDSKPGCPPGKVCTWPAFIKVPQTSGESLTAVLKYPSVWKEGLEVTSKALDADGTLLDIGIFDPHRGLVVTASEGDEKTALALQGKVTTFPTIVTVEADATYTFIFNEGVSDPALTAPPVTEAATTEQTPGQITDEGSRSSIKCTSRGCVGNVRRYDRIEIKSMLGGKIRGFSPANPACCPCEDELCVNVGNHGKVTVSGTWNDAALTANVFEFTVNKTKVRTQLVTDNSRPKCPKGTVCTFPPYLKVPTSSGEQLTATFKFPALWKASSTVSAQALDSNGSPVQDVFDPAKGLVAQISEGGDLSALLIEGRVKTLPTTITVEADKQYTYVLNQLK